MSRELRLSVLLCEGSALGKGANMKSMVREITELRALPLPDLVVRYTEVFGKEPSTTSRELLWKEIAWKLQADRAGGAPESAAAKVERLAGDVTFTLKRAKRAETAPPTRRKADDPEVGTVLVRLWHGKEVRLQAVEGGYEVGGVVFRTLSEAARAVTGAHWNGRLFWGLTSRRKRTP
jgi:hypothetical protein